MPLKPRPMPKGIPVKGVRLTKAGKLGTVAAPRQSVSAKIAAKKRPKVRILRRTP